MAIRFYDEAIVKKIQKWIPEEQHLKVLKPEETSELFSMKADENKDKPLSLPMIALSRTTDIEILNTNKQVKTFDGVVTGKEESGKNSVTLNAIPIQLTYQLDIYTRHMAEADEFLREFIFNLINYPRITIDIPYNGANLTHDSNIRLISTIQDNSDIPEKRFKDQFTRYSIGFVVDDAYLFSVPVKTNKVIESVELYVEDMHEDTTQI